MEPPPPARLQENCCRICLQAASDVKTQYTTKTKKREHVMLHCQFQHGFSSKADSTSDATFKQKFLLCFPGETPCWPDSNCTAAKASGSERRNWLLKKKRIAEELQSGQELKNPTKIRRCVTPEIYLPDGPGEKRKTRLKMVNKAVCRVCKTNAKISHIAECDVVDHILQFHFDFEKSVCRLCSMVMKNSTIQRHYELVHHQLSSSISTAQMRTDQLYKRLLWCFSPALALRLAEFTEQFHLKLSELPKGQQLKIKYNRFRAPPVQRPLHTQDAIISTAPLDRKSLQKTRLEAKIDSAINTVVDEITQQSGVHCMHRDELPPTVSQSPVEKTNYKVRDHSTPNITQPCSPSDSRIANYSAAHSLFESSSAIAVLKSDMDDEKQSIFLLTADAPIDIKSASSDVPPKTAICSDQANIDWQNMMFSERSPQASDKEIVGVATSPTTSCASFVDSADSSSALTGGGLPAETLMDCSRVIADDQNISTGMCVLPQRTSGHPRCVRLALIRRTEKCFICNNLVKRNIRSMLEHVLLNHFSTDQPLFSCRLCGFVVQRSYYYLRMHILSSHPMANSSNQAVIEASLMLPEFSRSMELCFPNFTIMLPNNNSALLLSSMIDALNER